MSPAAPADRAWYVARINRVVDYIDAHLGDLLDLGVLAEVACFSPWHFHRVFHAMTGETLAERVRRRRLEVAANRLLAAPPTAALQIALEVGFGSAEVFTRAFRAYFGVTPSGWRRGAYREWAERNRIELRKIHQADRKANQEVALAFHQDAELWPRGEHPHEPGQGDNPMDVEIRSLPETRVAYLRHVGPYGSSEITQLWPRFAAWCASAGLMSPRRKMFGISQDNPDVTPPEKCRYDACIPVDANFRADGEIGVQTIWGGRYACARFTGPPTEIHAAWMRFCGEWLPESGYQGDDHPALELYEEDFTVDPTTGAFSCLLCIPVKPITRGA